MDADVAEADLPQAHSQQARETKSSTVIDTEDAGGGAVLPSSVGGVVYSIRVSILNIGRYIAITMMPTIAPTRIIISGSMIEVSAWMAASTSSS
jgi:hypothetical protein